MQHPAQNPYTPDKIPIEIPQLPESVLPKAKSSNASTFMVLGIIVFVVIIFVQAFYLVRTTTNTQSEAVNQGPALIQ